MNKKIKELIIKAQDRSAQMEQELFSQGASASDFFPEILIELVVRECARAVDKVYEDAEPDHGCYDWATWAEGADVLKHFGVK